MRANRDHHLPSHGELRKAVLETARRHDVPEKRLRDWVAYMMLGAMLDSPPPGAPRATIKGGIAIELRLHPTHRATQDMDVALAVAATGLLSGFDAHIRAADGTTRRVESGFSFQRKGAPRALPHDGQRIQVQVWYKEREWTTIMLDLGTAEDPHLPHEPVPAIDLTSLGLQGPTSLQVLHRVVQIPQKIHGMTRPPRAGETRNERVRDLLDVLLLRDMLPDLKTLRDHCVEVFAHRNTHAWPPTVVAHAHWETEYAKLAREWGVPYTALLEGVSEAQVIIDAIDGAE